jgi:hypothetical protein
MYRTKLAVVVGLLLVFQTSQVCFAQVSFTDMLRRVPREANALVMVDAEKMRKSPIALAKENVNRRMILPKEVDRVVLASNLDTANMKAIWEVAIVSTIEEPSMAKIADKRGGKLENFGEESAVLLPTNSYLVGLGSKLLGIQYPADRQHAARWARLSRDSKGLQFGRYLQGASKYPEAVGTDIILALDLEHVVSADTVRQNLNNSAVLKGREVNLDQLSFLLASIQGTTLGIRVTDKISGSLRIDFSQDASIMADFAKPLILEKIGELGAAIEDLYSWTSRVEGKTVYLSGIFSVDGLRKVLSIVEPPPLPVEQPAPGQKVTSPSERDPMAYATYDHFKETQVLIADLRKTRNPALGSSGQCALWYDKYAKKLDQLPIVNVDPELLDFTQELAVSLRGLAGTYRQVGINSAQYSGNPTSQWRGGYTGRSYGGYGYSGGYGYRGGYGPGRFVAAKKTGPSPRATAKRLGRASASQTRSEKFQTLDEGMAKMRRSLTEKYHMEF